MINLKPIMPVLSILIMLSNPCYPANEDTFRFDIKHYSIHLNITNIPAKEIGGFCKVDFKSVEDGVKQIHLFLKALHVDSIISNGEALEFNHLDPILSIDLGKTLNAEDSDMVTIYYHGNPVEDAQWGGFYFSGGYAFNMGIGMADYPNAYGRVWFPCVDNFIDHATYSFYITAINDHKAICSGILEEVTDNGDSTNTWHWELKQLTTTDLVSVAVGIYEMMEFLHHGIQKDYPVIYGVPPADTTKMKSSFAKMPQTLDAFESLFGPFPYDRVGFVVVPFNAGAMEHTTNIAYPRYAVNGGLNYEYLYAHELAHSWWGNMVKCKVSEEMWLNEGWAVYSEHLFHENIYGKQAYKNAVRQNHKFVLHYAHIIDGMALPLTPVSHANTYGKHVYDKGGDVVHTLRNYLGDSLFFIGIKKYLSQMAWQNSTSIQLRDSLSKYTNYDLSDFFDNWVFEPGFPHFSIDSFSYSGSGGNYQVKVYLRQMLRVTNNFYQKVPLKLTFMSKDWQQTVEEIIMSGQTSLFELSIPFKPEFIAVDLESDISDAKTKYYHKINSTGTYDFEEALMIIEVNNIQDSAFLLVEHNWVGPDIGLIPKSGIRFSNYRYWTVSGLLPDSFDADATIMYNGSQSGSYDGNNYLDHTLKIDNEDSLILLYRESRAEEWRKYDDYKVIMGGNKTNAIGSIRFYNIKPGDYCLGKYDHTAGYGLRKLNEGEFVKIYPNPTNSVINIELLISPVNFTSIKLLNLDGKTITEIPVNNKNLVQLPINNLKPGIYIVEVYGYKQRISRKIILN